VAEVDGATGEPSAADVNRAIGKPGLVDVDSADREPGVCRRSCNYVIAHTWSKLTVLPENWPPRKETVPPENSAPVKLSLLYAMHRSLVRGGRGVGAHVIRLWR
jgi:hypothetical protein